MIKTVNVKSLGECPYFVSLQPEDTIGSGSSAHVCRAFNKYNTEENLAAKIFELENAHIFQSALKQLMIVSQLPKHPNLISYKKVKITSKKRLYIIMELGYSSLKKQMNQKKTYSEVEIWNFLNQISEGYKVLFKKSIIHRDIKPDNILIGFDGKYKITDFGLAEFSHLFKGPQKVKGSLLYIAPQLLEPNAKNKINSMNDVYSLGATIFQMCFHKLPYIRNPSNSNTFTKFIQQLNSNSLKFPQNHNYSNNLISLLSSMLEKDQSKRCSWEFIFYSLLKKQPHHEPILQKSLQNGCKNFRIIEISDTFLQNLSSLDLSIYKKLQNQSLIVIDHIEAEIISKRQIIFYCDQLQYKMQTLNGKISSQFFSMFNFLLLKFTFLMCEQLDKEFERNYGKLKESQFLKIVESQKYNRIRSLIKRDYQSLGFYLKQKESFLQMDRKFQKIEQLEILIYQKIYDVILLLYENKCFEECIQMSQLQKWIQKKNESQSVLSKIRKNENILTQFSKEISGVTSKDLKKYMAPMYLIAFTKIDKKKNQFN